LNDSRNMTESARMGSTASSDGSILVSTIDSPNSQLAKSAGKVSARNLQVLSYITEFYHLTIEQQESLTIVSVLFEQHSRDVDILRR